MPIRLDSPPERVCLLRLSAIGDVCHTIPVLRTLQHAWPDTRITWIIGRNEATLVGDIPEVEFIIFDKSKGLGAYRDLRRHMRGRRYDVLLHLQSSLRASLASTLIPAELRLGFDRRLAKDYQWLFTNQRVPAKPQRHVMDSLLDFTQALDITARRIAWDIPLSQADREFAARYVGAERRTLIISPCASARRRNWRDWPAERYAAVCKHAMRDLDMAVILTGGGTDRERRYGQLVASHCSTHPTDLIGKLTLKQLLAILSGAQVLLSPDSGPAHMATTVGTPVIGLYGTTNPLRTGPYLGRQWVVNRYPDNLERFCGQSVDEAPWGKRVRHPDAMSTITVEEVVGKLHEIIKD